jgi:hypothetical protein
MDAAEALEQPKASATEIFVMAATRNKAWSCAPLCASWLATQTSCLPKRHRQSINPGRQHLDENQRPAQVEHSADAANPAVLIVPWAALMTQRLLITF